MTISTLVAVTIMCILGYIGFVFVGESMNVMKRSQVKALRLRHRHGLMVGSLIALSSIATFFVDGSVLDKLKISLPTAAVLLAIYLTYALIAGLINKNRSTRRDEISDPVANTVDAKLVTASNSAQTIPMGMTNHGTDATHPTQSAAMHNEAEVEATTNLEESVQRSLLDEASVGSPSHSHLSAEHESDHPLDEVTIPQEPTHPDFQSEWVDQIQPELAENPEFSDSVGSTRTVDLATPVAANNHQFSSTHTVDQDEIVVDDFFDPPVSTFEEPESVPVESIVEEPQRTETPVTDDRMTAEEESEINIDTNDTVDMNDVYTASVEETFTPESYEPADVQTDTAVHMNQEADTEVEIEPLGSYVPTYAAHEYDQLANAMDHVNAEAERIEGSVNKINELHEREQYYRTELNGARLALEKAQEADHEARMHEIKIGKRQLQEEKSRRMGLENNLAGLENNLEDRRKALFEAENRVRELEEELFERRRVFHDQLESLSKTKAMARNAALLARKAAVAQQSARTTALKERAARERLEVSAKRAVDIARNAISKLAEEERKNRSAGGLH